MDDAKIVQLYWDRNEQAISATADKYGNYCAAIAKIYLVTVRIQRSASMIHT